MNTFCEYHYGDSIVTLNYLMKLSEQNPDDFVYYCPAYQIPQLQEMLVQSRVQLRDIKFKPADAVNVWKNRLGDFYTHPDRNDWLKYHLVFFNKLSRELGFENPMWEDRDFLLNTPAIRNRQYPHFDCLVINSPPMSNQLTSMGPIELDGIIRQLQKKHTVITTARNGCDAPVAEMSLMDIGSLSLGCQNIIGVGTAPMWPCLNVWNDDKYKLFFLDEERVEISPNTDHSSTYDEAMGRLTARGLL